MSALYNIYSYTDLCTDRNGKLSRKKVYTLAADNCSPFGRYETKADLMSDVKEYGLKLKSKIVIPQSAMADDFS